MRNTVRTIGKRSVPSSVSSVESRFHSSVTAALEQTFAASTASPLSTPRTYFRTIDTRAQELITDYQALQATLVSARTKYPSRTRDGTLVTRMDNDIQQLDRLSRDWTILAQRIKDKGFNLSESEAVTEQNAQLNQMAKKLSEMREAVEKEIGDGGE